MNQEAVLDLHPEELHLYGDEEEEEEGQGIDNGRADHNLGLKIRRTVTQVVPGDGKENGQGREQQPQDEEEEEEEDEEEQRLEKEKQHKASKERRRSSARGDDAAWTGLTQSLIPDIKMNQEAVLDLHPEELHLYGDEEEEEEGQGMDNGRADHDLGLKIRRTVTQSTTPKAFAGRKIPLNSSKTSPPTGADGGAAAAGTAVESETGAAAGRKRRWGSSTAVTTKKPSISITTDSLRSLIPDIKMNQEAVLDLHPEELHLYGDEEEEEEGQGIDNGRADHNLGLKIRRTVTQVVPGDGKENGQGREQQPQDEEEEEEEDEEEQRLEKEKQHKASKERRRSSARGDDAAWTGLTQSLIPDIKMNQEAVLDLHPEELHLYGDEEEEEEGQGMDNGRADHDLGLKIRRTVTQSTTPKAFAGRKIPLNSSKTSPPTGADGGAAAAGTAVESETGAAAGRKRRWGSSTAVTTKKPSISITTDSLRSLIPDFKMNQEAVLDLHPEELHLYGDEEEEEEGQGMDNGRADHDLGLKIRHTVTQVVPGDGKENGQGREQQPQDEEVEEEEDEEEQRLEKEKQHKASKERRRSSTRGDDAAWTGLTQSLIPDIKMNQEAVLDLHPEELHLYGDEEEEEEGQGMDNSRADHDLGLKIRRTVTQSTTPKAFAGRKIPLNSSKTSPPTGADGGAAAAGTAVESETGAAAGRKRRWGSSTAVTTKKPSISITTDSLRSLIPDIKMNQEAVLDLHPEELHLYGDDEEEEEGQGMDNGRADQDLGLKTQRTVTQVVPGDGKENGQGREQQPQDEEEEEEEDEEEQRLEKEKQHKASKERRRSSARGDDAAPPRHSPPRQEAEAQKGCQTTPLGFQQSPDSGATSLSYWLDLLKRTGSVLEEGFWIDKIKSHCFVTYATTDEAQATRGALHGLKWPPCNPKVLSVDFSQQDELDFHRGTLKVVERAPEKPGPLPGGPPARLPPLMPELERDRDKGRERGGAMREQWAEHGPMGLAMRDPWAERGGPLGGGGGGGGFRDQWAEREREMQRREQARCEREWDRDKIREFGQPGEEMRRSRSRDRERRRRERAKSKERKGDKKDEPPAKLLDDLFLKTKAAPCIYWLPLTEEQVKKRKEQEQEDSKRKRKEERKERLKAREAGGPAGGGGGSGGGAGGGGSGGGRGGGRAMSGARRADAPQEREGDRKREGFRPRGPSGGAVGGGGAGCRSRSRSNPRGRRR